MLTPSVSAVLDGKIFLVLRGELEFRFDALFYAGKPNTNGFIKVGSFVNVKGGKRVPKGMGYSEEETNFLYLRVDDIDEFGNIKIDNLKYLPQEVFGILEYYELYPNEVVISIAGTIGKITLLKENLNKRIVLTENAAKLIIRTKNILPDYLKILLELPIVQKQMQLSYIQTTIPKLALERIVNLKVPVIPPLNIQQEIVAKFEAAFAAKRAKEAEAARLLASIDGYLLEQLGITLPEVKEQKKTFFVCSNKVSGGRFDPFYFANQHYKIEGGIYENKTLRQIATLDKGQSITKDSIISGEYPVIAGGQTSPYSHENYNQKADVITISASGAYSGYVWYHNYPIFASDCTVIRSKDENEISTLFLSEILKLKQREIYNLQQGAGQPHVYANDLAKLMVPIPTIDIQSEIMSHIAIIRTQAQQLEDEAKVTVEAAKKEVEAMILGEGGNT